MMRVVDRPPRPWIRAVSAWYFVVPIATFGLLAFVPFVHAAVRLRRSRLWWLPAAYGAFTVLFMTLMNAASDAQGNVTGPLSDIATLAAIAVVVVACVQLTPMRRESPTFAASTPTKHRRSLLCGTSWVA